jgi:NADH:ubiquinone oxidoreductase subunit B-like Fe-S oxidoreductase
VIEHDLAMTRTVPVAIATVAVILSGCGSPGALPNRSSLPACGVIDLEDSLASRQLVARCFAAAADSGRPAELIANAGTVEGKRYREIDRVLGKASFEAYVYVDGKWSHGPCRSRVRGAVRPPFLRDCQS